MNNSRYSRRVRALLVPLLIITILAIGVGILQYEASTSSMPQQFGTDLLKEEGPGLGDGPAVEIIKEEGPGLRDGEPEPVEIVKEEGPGLIEEL